jgi:hypothetical protein
LCVCVCVWTPAVKKKSVLCWATNKIKNGTGRAVSFAAQKVL